MRDALAQDLAARWRLELRELLTGATCSAVYAGSDDAGREIVLKIPDWDSEERHAIPSLLAFATTGGMPILQYDPETGAVVMPRLCPGTTLEDRPEEEAVDICIDVIQRLREVHAKPGPPLDAWYAEFRTAPDTPLVREAVWISRHLLDTAPAPRLLHADLHHGNILQHGDGWLAIDPKGMGGDPSFEIAGFMRNPLNRPPDALIQKRRLERFAERLGDPPERLWGWAFVQTLLSATWCDPGPAQMTWQRLAEELWEIRQQFGE